MDTNIFLKECEEDLKQRFDELEDIAFYNQKKILKAFQNNKVALRHFYGSTGYAYDDVGKETLNKIYAEVFECEKAIASPLITCGTHALFLGLSSILRPNDIMLSITGEPYDTLIEAIKGNASEDIGSLKDFGIKYEQIELNNGQIDIEKSIEKIVKLKPKLVYMQRSRGYSIRNAISTIEFETVIKKIREVDKNCYIFIDNCYGEFVEKREPSAVGADLVVGSLCKNPGGG
ncbi:MAG: methionine gamma-lyase family protein, partial [Clostridia bacterium]|nr:methionine gamma-lyase family protein [Clostridia bacterium]